MIVGELEIPRVVAGVRMTDLLDCVARMVDFVEFFGVFTETFRLPGFFTGSASIFEGCCLQSKAGVVAVAIFLGEFRRAVGSSSCGGAVWSKGRRGGMVSERSISRRQMGEGPWESVGLWDILSTESVRSIPGSISLT